MTTRNDVISIPLSRNSILETTQLPEALEANDEGVSKVKVAGFLRVTMNEVNGMPERRDCILDVIQLPKMFGNE